jgi:hypothetical protein
MLNNSWSAVCLHAINKTCTQYTSVGKVQPHNRNFDQAWPPFKVWSGVWATRCLIVIARVIRRSCRVLSCAILDSSVGNLYDDCLHQSEPYDKHARFWFQLHQTQLGINEYESVGRAPVWLDKFDNCLITNKLSVAPAFMSCKSY